MNSPNLEGRKSSKRRLPPLLTTILLLSWIAFVVVVPAYWGDRVFIALSGLAAVSILAVLNLFGRLRFQTARKRLHILSIGIFALGVFMILFGTGLAASNPMRVEHFVWGGVLITIAIAIGFLFDAAIKRSFGLHFLSGMQALTFEGVAQALIDGGKMDVLSGKDLVENVDTYLASFKSDRKIEIKLSLFGLEYLPLLHLRPPMSWMSSRMRVAFIKKYLLESKGTLRNLLRSATQLSYLAYYGDKRTFPITGYKPFEERERAQNRPPDPVGPSFDFTIPETRKTIETDVLVIGSGAAGALLAHRFAEQGKNVIMLERGKRFVPQSDFTNVETQMIGRMYVDGGLQLTQDFNLAILQGSGVGGTTLINNGICFRIPSTILDDFDALGARIDRDLLDKKFAKIETRLNVHPLERNILNQGSVRFMNGAMNLNMNPQVIQTNFNDCLGSGNCNLGCKYNRKLSMLLTYIPWAVEKGATVIAESEAIGMEHDGKSVSLVRCKTKAGVEFAVRAKQVVVAGGAIGSSMFLRQCDITKNVGTRISFNIAAPMHVLFNDIVDSFDGVQMCVYARQGDFLLETSFNPPAATSLIMQGWFEEHYDRMKNYRRLGTVAPVVGTKPVGTIKKAIIGGNGVDFKLDPGDFEALKRGVAEISRVLFAGGAEEIYPSTFHSGSIKSEADIERVVKAIVNPEDMNMSSAHPQGGNPMSDNRDIGAVDSNFRVHGFSNLFVADASVFPVSIHVNPQLTIMALAEYAADKIMSL
jgi:choline dehydrogenase-like flavoprotein